MFCPCETRTSTCRNFATISSGLYRFLAITVLLDAKDIPQVGPLQWGRIMAALRYNAISATQEFDGGQVNEEKNHAASRSDGVRCAGLRASSGSSRHRSS